MPTYADLTGAGIVGVMATPGVATRAQEAGPGMAPPPVPARSGSAGLLAALAPSSPIPALVFILAVAWVLSRRGGLMRTGR